MKTINHEIVSDNIFDTAINLTDDNLTELYPTDKYSECDSLFINHQNNNFWFTTKKTAKHTLKMAQLN